MRTFYDAARRQWQVEVISHGQTSTYLHERVHKPILQFSCLDGSQARRYVSHSADTDVAELSDQALCELLARSSTH